MAPQYLIFVLLSLSQVRTERERELTECNTEHHQAALSLHTATQCRLVSEVVELQLPPAENIIQVEFYSHFIQQFLSQSMECYFIRN